MPTLQEQLQTAVDQTTTDSNLLHDVVHGDDQTEVTTENGNIKSVAKVLAENQQLLTDSAATLTTKRDEAVASAAAAALSETACDEDATQTAADVVTTNNNVSATNADVVTTTNNKNATDANVTTTNNNAASTATDATTTNDNVAITNADVVTTTNNKNATAADVITTNANVVASNSSASDAAASAAAAAGSAAGQFFSEVIDLTFADSPFTIPSNGNGNLYRVDSIGGDVELELPELSTLAADFRIGVAKASSDINTININRTGSDTVNGLPSRTLSAQYNIDTFIGDKDNATWFASGGGLGAVNITVQQLDGDGSTVTFSLSGTPGSENNTNIFIHGAYQQKDSYSLTGNQLTFSEAPPIGTKNIEVVFGAQVPIGTPSNDTVNTVHLKSQSVTREKMANGTPNTLLGYGPTGEADEVPPPQAFLPGMIMPYAGAVAPAGWLFIYGQAVSRTEHPSLFAAIGTAYGVGDGSTTFNLPDARGRTLVGMDNMGGASSNRLTSSQADVLGGSGGSEQSTPTGSVSGSTGSTTLSTPQIPSHTHTFIANNYSGSTQQISKNFDRANFGTETTSATGGGGSHNHSLSASFSGNSMTVTQPWMACNYIIKT